MGTATTSADPTTGFFHALAERGHEPLLTNASGTLRFDVTDGGRVDRWLVSIEDGDVSVSKRNASADAVLRIDRAVFDRLVTGEANAMAALLRGLVEPKGDLGLLMQFQRVFPGPHRMAETGAPTSGRGGSS